MPRIRWLRMGEAERISGLVGNDIAVEGNWSWDGDNDLNTESFGVVHMKVLPLRIPMSIGAPLIPYKMSLMII